MADTQDPVCEANVKDQNDFDEFLDDATHAIGNMWHRRGGRPLTSEELYEINDWLTAYFGGKRPSDYSGE